jgi:hypothetical protein
MDTASGGHTDMRSVSLEPVELEAVQREKNFHEKWPMAEFPKKKFTPILFYGKFLLLITQLYEGAIKLLDFSHSLNGSTF